MKTKLLFFFAFLLLVSSSAFSQNEKKDYLDFDSNGNLLTFKKTAPDGSWVEMGDKVKGSKYRYLTIKFANGDILNSYYNCDEYNTTVESAYTGYFEKAQTFSDLPSVMKAFAEAREKPHPYGPGMGEIKNRDENEYYSVLVKADGTKFRLYNRSVGIYYNLCINECTLPLNDKGDYIKCGLNDRKYNDLDITDLGTKISYAVMAVRKTYDNCVLELNLTDRWGNKISDGSIEYKDKSSYSGTFILGEGNSFYDWQFWRDSKEFPENLNYKDGVLTTKDKKYKAYANGEYSEFQTAKVTQSLEKKAAEEKAEAEAIKKAKIQLNKKYGEKYVNAMLKGNLILGTPEGLFVLGVQVNAYPNITKANCYYSNGNTSLYDVYGWRIDPNRTVALTNVAYLGILRFENGALVSIYK